MRHDPPRRPRHYESIDSAPPVFAVRRPAWLPLATLAVFVVAAAGLLLASPVLESAYASVLRLVLRADVAAELQGSFPLRLRPFFWAFFAAFLATAAGLPGTRIRAAALLLVGYPVVALLVDASVLSLAGGAGPVALLVAHVATGFVALVMFSGTLLALATLPADSGVAGPRGAGRTSLVLGGAIAVAATASGAATAFLAPALEGLRSVALLGGIGPGIVLFFPVLAVVLTVVARRRLRRSAPWPPEAPSVGILIPALDEEPAVAACISSIERAVAGYPGPCRLYLVDNGSTDGTVAAARATLSWCTYLRGEVLHCDLPGKARALNHGLARMTEDVVVRVDADTQIAEDALTRAVRHLLDPGVGVVGGIPLPRGGSTWMHRVRTIEVLVMHGFGRLAASAVDALLTVPGTFAAYRRSSLVAVGGFAEGMNGEDSDVTVRIGRLGDRVVQDPAVRVFTEVPATWQQLREQRLRWLRSIFHVCGRNRSAVRTLQGVRGAVAIPWALIGAARRPLTIPIVLYAGLAVLLQPGALFVRQGAAVAAVVFGVATIVYVGVLVAYRRLDLLPSLPSYLAFRVARSYLALESLATVPFGDRRRRVAQRVMHPVMEAVVVPAERRERRREPPATTTPARR